MSYSAETYIPDEAHGNHDRVQTDVRAGRVFLNVRTEGFGEHNIFLTVQQARQVALQIEAAAQAAHVSMCDTCQAARGDDG